MANTEPIQKSGRKPSDNGNLNYSEGSFAEKWDLVRLHISVLIMGHTTLFAKWLSFSAVTIISFRALTALFFLGCWTYFRKGSGFLALKEKKDLFWFFIMGGLMTAHWVTYFHSLQISTIAIGMVSLFTYPVFTAILEPFFFRGSVRLVDAIVAVYMLLGICIVGWGSGGLDFFSYDGDWVDRGVVPGIAWGLFSAILYSLRNLLAKKNLKNYSSSTLMVYQLFVCFILTLPFIEIHNQDLNITVISQFLLLGLLFTAIAHTMYLQSLKSMPATTVGILSTISPVYGTLGAWLYLSETPSWGVLVGGFIVISGSIFESWKMGRRFEKKSSV